jgi:uncharacterized protein YbaR (Trm112 family)
MASDISEDQCPSVVLYLKMIMLDESILPLLRCPATKQPLRPATAEEKLAHGVPPNEEAFATADGTRIYRTLNALPVLLSTTEAG